MRNEKFYMATAKYAILPFSFLRFSLKKAVLSGMRWEP